VPDATGGLSAAELAERAGVPEADIDWMVANGILAPAESARAFAEADVRKVRLAKACQEAGLPIDGIGAAIADGKLSFAFLEASPFRRWASRSDRTYEQVSRDSGLPFDFLEKTLEAFGFTDISPGEYIREDEADIVPLLALGHATGVLDEDWTVRLARSFAASLRRMSMAENDLYHERFEMPSVRQGLDQRQAMELASDMAGQFNDLVDRTLLAAYRRQQELTWTDHLVTHIEAALEESGVHDLPERVPAMCFLDLVGYTRLTEERGDTAAAELADALPGMVDRTARGSGGEPVKWLGDGVMFHFPEPAGAVVAALEMLERLPSHGFPPGHVGIAAGPVVAQGGDYFGRTVNLAARLSARASAGQVLVTETVVDRAKTADGVTFAELPPAELRGFENPIQVFEARRN
jgi:adenylate cyclase